MKNAKIVERVSFKPANGVSGEETKSAMEAMNQFVNAQPGFISRTTSVSADGEFLDLVYWEDLHSAQQASEKAMKDESLLQHFQVIDQETMFFKHYEVFLSQ